MTDKTPSDEELHEPLNDSIDETQKGSSPEESGLRARLRKLADAMQHRAPAKADLTKDRTRSLALLIGATVAAVLLFLGVLSNPGRSRMQEMATRTEPNLGRPNTGNQSVSAQGSVTPLLNADVQSNNISSDQLSPADIRGTSRSSESDDCNPSDAEIPFDNILDRVTGSDPSVTDYILESPAKCPNCLRPILEKTLIGPR